MSDNIQTAQRYFDLSNAHDMAGISAMMTDEMTYSSVRQGVFLGCEPIIEMQTAFHASFEYLHWEIKSIEEIRPNVIYIDFVMRMKKRDDEMIEISGDEYVVAKNGKLLHVEVRNKPL